MKVEQVSPKSYRVRKTYQGKRYDVYFDHKPNQREVMEVISDKMQSGEFGAVKGTFEDACSKYIDSKRNVLSPSTAGGYRKLIRTLSDEFKAMNINSIELIDVQNEINRYAENHSPKSVRNLHGFISSVLKTFRPKLKLSTALPQKKKYKRNMPTTDAVKQIIELSKGTPYHIGFQLAALGLRRSEICGITIDDIKGNILTIDKTRLYDEENHLITRDNTKTEDSTREVYLPDSLVEEIQQAGIIYDRTPPMLVKTLHKYQDMIGAKHFTLHDMRAYFASYAHLKGIPDEYIMKMGGWKTDFCMKNIYRGTLDDKTADMQRRISEDLLTGV